MERRKPNNERTTGYSTFEDWLREYAGENEWLPTHCAGGRRYREHGEDLWDEVWDQAKSSCLEALGLEMAEVLDGTSCEYDEELDDYIHQLVCDVRVIIESGCPEKSEDHNALEPH